MKYVAVTLAFALGLSGANATACTIVDVTTLNGVEGGDTDACVGTTLAPGATCNLKVSAGYTGASGTLINTCHASDGTLTTTASVADQTGCAADYHQSAGSTAADGVCTACGTGEYIPAKATFDGTTVANCDGCKANFYQSGGTSATDGACTVCAGSGTLATAAFGGATTTCAEAASSTASSVRFSAISTAFAASAAAAALM